MFNAMLKKYGVETVNSAASAASLNNSNHLEVTCCTRASGNQEQWDNMYEKFLITQKTIPHRDRDFVKWHGGIAHYGFWAIVVDDPNWLKFFDAACSQVRHFIHPGYQRLPHITIIACGLFAETHFSPQHLAGQLTALNEAMFPPFSLKAGSLNSFTSAPYITVEESTGTLNQIRRLLSSISEEDKPDQYQPHITLGLYRDAFDTLQVAKCLRGFQYTPIKPMLVTELVFCSYETKNVQGPVNVLERVKLDATAKNHKTSRSRNYRLESIST